jgi:hypothetical protein
MFKIPATSICAVAVTFILLCGLGCSGAGGGGIVPIDNTLSIQTESLPSGVVGVPYSATVVVSNGTAPYNFSTASGSLPTGLTMSAAGQLAGTPGVAGTYTFAVSVVDAASRKGSQSYGVTIAQPLQLGPTTLPAAIANASYSATLQITGGTAPYTVSRTAGALPPGLSLSTSGVVSGMATASGTYSFTAQAVDSGSPQQKVSTTIALSVVDATVQIDTTLPLATVPQNFFGMHTSVYDDKLSDVAALPALLQGTGITTLRYPGGSYADRYHWAQHSLTPLYGSTAPACDLVNGPVFEGTLAAGADFGSFAKTLQATGTQAVITVNYGTSTSDSRGSVTAGNTGVPNQCSEPNMAGQPQEAAAWVAYANGSPSNVQRIGLDAIGFDWKTVGFWAGLRAASPLAVDDGYNFLRINQAAPIGIKYWEIGNEMYYNGWAGNRNFEADLHAPYIYPGGYLGGQDYDSRDQLQALSPTAYGQNAIPFIQAMKTVDPTILVGVDFASPGATDPIPLNWNPDLAHAACANGMFDLAIIHYYPGTWLAVQPGELLSLPQSDIPRVFAGIQANLAQYCPANASAIKFILSETSPNGDLAPGFPQPVIGLFALNDYLTSLKTGIVNIDWLEMHNGTYLDESENPDPAYYGLELAHLLAGVGDKLVSANSSSGTVLSWATLKANGQKGVLLVNANPAQSAVVQVTVAGSALGTTATQYSYGVATTQTSTALSGSAFTVSGNTFNVTVPAYTAIELNIP